MSSRYSSEVNLDILCIMHLAERIGWTSLKEQSIQRIVYLSKVLYFFCNNEDDLFYYYHFSKSISGPYSDLIPNSIIFLYSNQFILKDDDSGSYKLYRTPPGAINPHKERWFKTIILILGKYGEERIFGFTINDPLYIEAVQGNSQKELNTSIENRTIQVLNEFKNAFEQSIEDTSSISSEEYLDLYFEYIFGQIIKSK